MGNERLLDNGRAREEWEGLPGGEDRSVTEAWLQEDTLDSIDGFDEVQTDRMRSENENKKHVSVTCCFHTGYPMSRGSYLPVRCNLRLHLSNFFMISMALMT